MTHQDDYIFIEKTIAGDLRAFEVLIDRYKQLVYTLSLRMMRQKEEAEEIAQDVFLKAFQKLSGFKGQSKFSTWLYRITYNACLDALSRKRTHPTHHAFEIKEGITIADGVEDMVTLLDTELIREEVLACIAQLPDAEAFIITLYYLEEQSLDEIASIIGLTKNNTKVKLFRIRKKLFTIMQSSLPQEIKLRYER